MSSIVLQAPAPTSSWSISESFDEDHNQPSFRHGLQVVKKYCFDRAPWNIQLYCLQPRDDRAIVANTDAATLTAAHDGNDGGEDDNANSDGEDKEEQKEEEEESEMIWDAQKYTFEFICSRIDDPEQSWKVVIEPGTEPFSNLTERQLDIMFYRNLIRIHLPVVADLWQSNISSDGDAVRVGLISKDDLEDEKDSITAEAVQWVSLPPLKPCSVIDGLHCQLNVVRGMARFNLTKEERMIHTLTRFAKQVANQLRQLYQMIDEMKQKTNDVANAPAAETTTTATTAGGGLVPVFVTPLSCSDDHDSEWEDD